MDNTAEETKLEYAKLMKEFAEELRAAKRLPEGPDKKTQMDDITERQQSSIVYFKQIFAPNATTNNGGGASEPTKDGGTDQAIAIRALEIDERRETSAAAGNEGKADAETSVAAAK